MLTIYFLICLFVIFPLLLMFTKWYDNRVDLGTAVILFFGSMVPVVNVILLGCIFVATMDKYGVWDKRLF